MQTTIKGKPAKDILCNDCVNEGRTTISLYKKIRSGMWFFMDDSHSLWTCDNKKLVHGSMSVR